MMTFIIVVCINNAAS